MERSFIGRDCLALLALLRCLIEDRKWSVLKVMSQDFKAGLDSFRSRVTTASPPIFFLMTTTTTTCWQQLLNEGDYLGAYISQECPCFVPGDGSWADFYFRLLHCVERPCHFTGEEEFLQRASQTTLQLQQQRPFRGTISRLLETLREIESIVCDSCASVRLFCHLSATLGHGGFIGARRGTARRRGGTAHRFATRFIPPIVNNNNKMDQGT